MEREPKSITKPYLVNLVREKIKDRKETGLGQVELRSYSLPTISEIRELFGGNVEFHMYLGYPNPYPCSVPEEFFEDYSEKTILVDTREKNPLKFKNTEAFTLDFGDYTLPSQDFTYTFVDRKSVEDFVSTIGLDFDRACREAQRCKDAGCYLFFVIDGKFEAVENYIVFNKWNLSSTHAHVMHNMREILRKYPLNCQFVFSGGRKKSQELIPKLLACGELVWFVDIQNYIDNVDKG
jgi:hypothetical protein